MAAAFVNTTIILVVSVAGTILIGTMAAYAIDRFEFRFKKRHRGLFLLATLVPAVTTQVATFQVVNDPRPVQHPVAAIALFMGTDIVSIYIFLQFMRAIPAALDEAATLDGANHFTIYRRIILPLLKPAIATVVIIKGIAIYNEFYIPFLYMPSQRPRRHLDVAVPVQGTVRHAVGGHLGRRDHRHHPDADRFPAAAAVHLQRLHRGRDK